MSRTITIKDTGDALNKLFAEVATLKQQVTSPNVMGATGGGTNEFDEIIINGPSGPIRIDSTISPALPADGQSPEEPLLLEPGEYLDEIFVDVTWNAPADSSAVEYEVEISEKVAADTYVLHDLKQTGATSVRFNGLKAETIYGVRVWSINRIGMRGLPLPEVGWQDVLTTKDTTVPPQVTAPVLSRGATALVVNFEGLTEAQAADVAWGKGLYEVQIATNNTFTANMKSNIGSASIVAFSDLTFIATWYARVRAIDSSGNVGPWSDIASLVAGQIISTQLADGAITETKIGPNSISTGKIQSNAIYADNIAGGQITSDKITVSGLDAAVIKFGSMSGDRIQANTLDVNVLKTSSLTSGNVTIAGGSLRVGTPTSNGILLSSLGLRGYKSGSITFNLDNTGNLTLSGTINGSAINSPWIDFGGGSITETYGIVMHVMASGYQPNRQLAWQDSTSPYTFRWAIFAPNASELYIQRTNKTSGQYSWLTMKTDRTYFENVSASQIGYFYYNGTGSLDRGLSVQGYFSVSGSKSFVIDHPSDPENSLLIHACIEGPEVGVYYRGVAEIGEDGSVVVELPHYFEDLTHVENRTVLLTPVGAPFPVGSTLPEDGAITIEGEAGRSVSWHVYAERKDIPRLEVEMDKEELAIADELASLGFYKEEGTDDRNTLEGSAGPEAKREWAARSLGRASRSER